jgi:hypothetical protein
MKVVSVLRKTHCPSATQNRALTTKLFDRSLIEAVEGKDNR